MPTSAAASAPNACDSAVRCGTAVIGIQIAIGAPISEPSTMPISTHCDADVEHQSVPMTASAMPISPASTPWRAVRGWLSHLSERMNSAAATRYETHVEHGRAVDRRVDRFDGGQQTEGCERR